MTHLTRRAGLALSIGGAASLLARPGRAAPLDDLIERARKQGVVNSVGMPDDWANWEATWRAVTAKYGLKHTDTDMSSAEELAKFAAERSNASADIGDVGFDFCSVAVERGLAAPYKPSTFDQVPAWARDAEGRWMLAYTGTIAFVVASDVANPPGSWADLLTGTYKVAAGDVGKASQSNAAVLACAIAMGGDERRIDPAMDLFAKLARQKRLLTIAALPANMGRGEIQVGLMWDFNALNYRDKVGGGRFSVVIPSDGSVTSGYSTILNKFARNPDAAMLVREYIFSDEGQLNLADGYARPIRVDHLTLPEGAKAKLLPRRSMPRPAPSTPCSGATGPSASRRCGRRRC